VSGVGTVLLAHGSSRGEQVAVLEGLARLVHDQDEATTGDAGVAAGPHPVGIAFLDHHGPSLNEAVASCVAAGADQVVVVPVLLSDAFHARHDVPRVVKNASGRASVPVALADPLGLDGRLAEVVRGRVAALAIDDLDTVVVAAAGTGIVTAQDAFRREVRQWRGRDTYRLNAAFIAGGAPSAVELVETLVDQHQRVAVVPFLIAPGRLDQRLRDGALTAGALAVSEVLGADPILACIIRDRRDACARV
jgi:sirohydrochlorin ferrochelatase